jgi:hypothetical protein
MLNATCFRPLHSPYHFQKHGTIYTLVGKTLHLQQRTRPQSVCECLRVPWFVRTGIGQQPALLPLSTRLVRSPFSSWRCAGAAFHALLKIHGRCLHRNKVGTLSFWLIPIHISISYDDFSLQRFKVRIWRGDGRRRTWSVFLKFLSYISFICRHWEPRRLFIDGCFSSQKRMFSSIDWNQRMIIREDFCGIPKEVVTS